jgi:DNA-binding NtrC family response regulator
MPNLLFDREDSLGESEPSGDGAAPKPMTLSGYLEDCERRYLVQELTRHGWRMAATAAEIGISRKNLWERLRRLSIILPARSLGQNEHFSSAE